MHNLLSFLECYLVNLDTNPAGLLLVSHGASLETSSFASGKKSSGAVPKLFIGVVVLTIKKPE